jgi:branched-chain amino acid transport system ATP-binding protein
MKAHLTVVLVEQNFAMATALGDDFYLIDDGRTVGHGAMASLATDHELKKKYLGI